MVRMPQVTAAELVRVLKSLGFVEDRQQGSHLTMRRIERAVSLTVPMHTGVDVGRGLTVGILKDAGFTVDDYIPFAKSAHGSADPRGLGQARAREAFGVPLGAWQSELRCGRS